MFNALEKFYIGRRVRDIRHAFVKADMRCSFNLIREGIVPHDVLHGFVIPKEDAGRSVSIEFGTALTGQANIDAATKNAKSFKGNATPGAHGDWRCRFLGVREAIHDEQ